MSNKNPRPRVLYFTFITPSEKFGGGLAVLQSIYSLCSFADVVYFGPEYDLIEFEKYGIKLTESHILTQKKNRLFLAFQLLTKRISTSFYDSWKKNVQQIESSDFDCCYMDFTRQSFVVRWAHKKSIPIILRAHNVESDYFSSMFENNFSVVSLIRKILAKKSERECVLNADRVLALTQSDINRFYELYGKTKYNIELFPICVKHFEKEESIKLPEKFISITGSLWFGPNADGTIWFLDKVWRNIDFNISDKYPLVIAGSKPNQKILELTKELNNVFVFPNPESIAPFYNNAFLYIAPIFYGAGMKVKIAEALSCGVPVVTTKHASAGYEQLGKELFVCDKAQDFVNCIENFCKKDDLDLDVQKNLIMSLFEKYYSLSSSCCMIKKYVFDVISLC